MGGGFRDDRATNLEWLCSGCHLEEYQPKKAGDKGEAGMVAGDVRELTAREMRVYLHLLHETMEAAEVLAAQCRAIEIIARMEATGMAVQTEAA